MALKLEKDVEKRMVGSIKRYFREEMEEDIGDMKATFLLQFFLKELAPSVYNQAIVDAQAYLQNATSDLGGACYEGEFSFWNKKSRP